MGSPHSPLGGDGREGPRGSASAQVRPRTCTGKKGTFVFVPGAASPRAALHAGGTGTACYLTVTEPDPLAFAASASSHGGNKRRV